MPEEKPPEPAKPGEVSGAQTPPEAPAGTTPAAAGAVPKPTAEGAAKPAEAAKPAAAVAAPAAKAHPEKPAPAVPTGPVGTPWTGDILEALHKTFPDIKIEGFTYLKQNYLIVPREAIFPVSMFLKTDLQFALLSDLTAADYPKREQRFEVVYMLYSFPRNERLRVKVPLGEQETVESVTPVWSGADWMEREVFDMFGIRFDHHPNMTRILLPEEWEGQPLRKDYGILQQDTRWVKENLHIESGQ